MSLSLPSKTLPRPSLSTATRPAAPFGCRNPMNRSGIGGGGGGGNGPTGATSMGATRRVACGRTGAAADALRSKRNGLRSGPLIAPCSRCRSSSRMSVTESLELPRPVRPAPAAAEPGAPVLGPLGHIHYATAPPMISSTASRASCRVRPLIESRSGSKWRGRELDATFPHYCLRPARCSR